MYIKAPTRTKGAERRGKKREGGRRGEERKNLGAREKYQKIQTKLNNS